MRLMAILAAALGASQLFAQPAQADTYGFMAGVDTGTFTTGAASPVASGYFLLTDFDFTTLDAGGSSPIVVDFTTFNLDTAFNPVLDLFTNGGQGQYDDTGGFAKLVSSAIVRIAPFQVGDFFLTVSDGDNQHSYFQGPFEVTSGLPTPVPEPGAWALMIAGIGGIGLVQRGRKKALGPQLGQA